MYVLKLDQYKLERSASKLISALLARLPRPQDVAPACGAYLGAPLFQAIAAKRSLEGRAEEARTLHLGVEMGDSLALVMRDGTAALLAHLAIIRVVPPARRALHRVFELGFLVAALAPRTARSAIWHLYLTSVPNTRRYLNVGFKLVTLAEAWGHQEPSGASEHREPWGRCPSPSA